MLRLAPMLDRLEETLRTVPGASWRRTDAGIIVDPVAPDGFEVGISCVDGEYMVWFDGWHELFASPDEALRAVTKGLGPEYRLQITYRGGTPTTWTVQERVGDAWQDDGVTRVMWLAFWKPKRYVHKQNKLFPSSPQA